MILVLLLLFSACLFCSFSRLSNYSYSYYAIIELSFASFNDRSGGFFKSGRSCGHKNTPNVTAGLLFVFLAARPQRPSRQSALEPPPTTTPQPFPGRLIMSGYIIASAARLSIIKLQFKQWFVPSSGLAKGPVAGYFFKKKKKTGHRMVVWIVSMFLCGKIKNVSEKTYNSRPPKPWFFIYF